MKLFIMRQPNDSWGDCEDVLAEVRDKMEADYPEIDSYEVCDDD